MQQFYIGCAVWAYKGWIGDLFPAGSKSADLLSLYSRRLTTVEGNTTFYETNLFYFSVLPGCKTCPLTNSFVNHDTIYLGSNEMT